MRILVIALTLMAPHLANAEQPTYGKEVVTCPDGSKGALRLLPFTQPTAMQLADVCLSLQARTTLQPPPPTNTSPSQHVMTREEINRQAGALMRPPQSEPRQ